MSLPKKTEDACENCNGRCCRVAWTGYPTEWLERHPDIDYYQSLRSIGRRQVGDYTAFELYQPCSLYDEETGLCKDYENRPDFCREWPTKIQTLWYDICPLMAKRFPIERSGQKFRALKIPN